jgi:hypothetical protein
MRRVRTRLSVAAAVVLALAAGCSTGPSRSTANVVPLPSGVATGAVGASTNPAGAPGPRSSGPSATAAPSTKPPAVPPYAGQCTLLPADNVWHADVSHLPVLAQSATYVASIGTGSPVHADFGSGTWQGAPIGIPITTISGSQPRVHVSFQYASDSDTGPYPVPANPAIEGGPDSGGDRHVLLLDVTHCIDYELYAAYPASGGAWKAGSGAIFDLNSDKLRPAGWTSADAAGLPILPGLVTWADMKSGHIDHAIRVTVPHTQAAYIWPARHLASDQTSTSLPPMGLRLRLKASVDISHLPAQARIVAQAMKTYGVIVADNGSPWFISGAPDPHFDNDQLHALGQLTGADFEAVDESSLMISSSSGAAR